MDTLVLFPKKPDPSLVEYDFSGSNPILRIGMDRGNPEILGHTNGFLGTLQLQFFTQFTTSPISKSRVMFHQKSPSRCFGSRGRCGC